MFPEDQSEKVLILTIFNPIPFLKEEKKVHQFFLTWLYSKQALGEMECWTVSDHMTQTRIPTSLCYQILTLPPSSKQKKSHAISAEDWQHKERLLGFPLHR